MRGEVWTIAAQGNLSKPRPAVIVQSDSAETSRTVIVCPLTSADDLGGDYISPTESNGLLKPSRPMATQVAAVFKSRLGERVGKLDDGEMSLVSDELRMALDL